MLSNDAEKHRGFEALEWVKSVFNLVYLEDHSPISSAFFNEYKQSYLDKTDWHVGINPNDLENLSVFGPIEINISNQNFLVMIQPIEIISKESASLVMKTLVDANMLDGTCGVGILANFVSEYFDTHQTCILLKHFFRR